jgi:hypothetical protein
LPSPKAAQAVSIAAGTNIKNCADDFFITSFSTRKANIQTGTKWAGFTEQAKYSAYSHWPDVNFELSLKTISAVAARFKGRWSLSLTKSNSPRTRLTSTISTQLNSTLPIPFSHQSLKA